MKALWWDDLDGRRMLHAFIGGIGWGLLIAAAVTRTLGLVIAALLPLLVALAVNLGVMRQARLSRKR